MKVILAFVALLVCACATLASSQVISLQKCDVTYDIDSANTKGGVAAGTLSRAKEDVKDCNMKIANAKKDGKLPPVILELTKALQSAEIKLKAAQAAADLEKAKMAKTTPAGILSGYRAATQQPWTIEALKPARGEYSPLRRYVSLDNPVLEARLRTAMPNCMGGTAVDAWRSAYAKWGNYNFGRMVLVYFEDALSLLDAAAAKCDAFVKSGSAPGVALTKVGRCEVAVSYDKAARKWSVKK